MMNGDGNGGYQGEDTPNERPEATLAEHRPYVLALLSAATGLHGTARTCQELAHELRIARDPIGASTKQRIAEMFSTVEKIGAQGRDDFGGE